MNGRMLFLTPCLHKEVVLSCKAALLALRVGQTHERMLQSHGQLCLALLAESYITMTHFYQEARVERLHMWVGSLNGESLQNV